MAAVNAYHQFTLAGAWNFRDVGGARSDDGKRVRPGVLFRASELSGLDPDGVAALSEMGIREVYDLRGDAEIERSGEDRLPDGVRGVAVPFDNSRGERAPHEAPASTEQTQIEYMLRAYSTFPALDGADTAIAAVAEALLTQRGPILVHCAAGKDRAGWTVATVLRAAGVAHEDILADYLESNAAMDPLLDHVRRIWNGPALPDNVVTSAILGVQESYLQRGLDEVDALHGSFEHYLDHLGLDSALRRELRGAILTD